MNASEIKTATADLKDDQVRGLQLRVYPNGRKSFYLYYRSKGGEQRRPKIGDWPTITLTAARDIATSWLRRVAAGEDPSKENQDHRAAVTVKEFSKTYMDDHGNAKKSSGEDQRIIDKHIVPEIGSVKMVDVEDTHIAKIKKKLKDTPVQANRVLALLSKIFNLAEEPGYKVRPKRSNPCYGITRYPERKRRRYATREEAASIYERLRFYRAKYPQQVAFLWLEIYTGARPSEIAKARPGDIRGDAIILGEHKTDGTGDDRVIHLPRQALELIQSLPPNKDGTLLGIKKPRHLWEKILKDTGLQNLHMYDLRHSFASIALKSGKTLEEIGGLLGHKSPETTSRYAHLIDEHGKDIAGEIADAFDEFAKAKPKLRVVE